MCRCRTNARCTQPLCHGEDFLNTFFVFWSNIRIITWSRLSDAECKNLRENWENRIFCFGFEILRLLRLSNGQSPVFHCPVFQTTTEECSECRGIHHLCGPAVACPWGLRQLAQYIAILCNIPGTNMHKPCKMDLSLKPTTISCQLYSWVICESGIHQCLM